MCVYVKERERERETDRETDRETERQTERVSPVLDNKGAEVDQVTVRSLNLLF